jgi:hypothetical protein
MLEIPSVEEVRDAMRMPRSRFRELAESYLAQSGVFERALKSDVYRQLWEGKTFSHDVAGLLQMPVLTPVFYGTNFEEKDKRIPAGPVKAGNDGWLCSTGSIKMKYYPFSDYDALRLGAFGSRYDLIAGFSKDDVLINAGAEPPHCSLTMAQWIAGYYGNDSIQMVRGMKPEEVMGSLMKKAGKIVGITGVPLVTIHSLKTIEKKSGRSIGQLFPKFKKAILGAETLNGRQRGALEMLGIEGYEIYASAELSVPGVECARHEGPHLFCDDNIYYLKTDGGTKYIWDCQKGDIGELFVTTPNREAFPLVNFSTNDVIEVLDTECPCGITHPRVRVIARTDSVLNVGGAKAYERHIEEKFEEVGREYPIPDWQIHWSRDENGGYHRFDVLIDLLDNDAFDKVAVREALLRSLSRDSRTQQLFQAQEAGILNIEVTPLPHKEYEEKVVAARHKRVRIVKKF